MAIMEAAFTTRVNKGAVKSCHFCETQKEKGHGFVRERMARLKGSKAFFLLNREVEKKKESWCWGLRRCGWTVGIGSVVFVCLFARFYQISRSPIPLLSLLCMCKYVSPRAVLLVKRKR